MKRVNESVALGYVASRTVESILILVGVVSLMSIVALRQDFADAASNSGALTAVAGGLLAVHDQIALLGPQLCAGLGNGILLGYLMWRSRLLPRPLVMIGLIGGPWPFAGIGVLLGAWGIRLRTSGRTHSARGHLGALAQCLAPRQRLPALTDPHRPAGDPEQDKLTAVFGCDQSEVTSRPSAPYCHSC